MKRCQKCSEILESNLDSAHYQRGDTDQLQRQRQVVVFVMVRCEICDNSRVAVLNLEEFSKLAESTGEMSR